jgi:membrane protease YdiL (CAAX protease family)
MWLRALILRHPAIAYFAMTFAISWGGILAIVGPTNILAPPDVFERMHWVPALVLGPSLSGVVLTAVIGGRQGLRDLRARLLRWRVPAYWYAIALLLAPLYNLLTCLALSSWSPAFVPGFLATDDPVSYLVSGTIVALTAGIFEELGWTGFATPMLRRRYSAPITGLIIGLMWGLWHVLPKLLGARAFDSLPVLPLELAAAIVGLTGYRILMVWVYDHTRSLLVGIAMHAGLTAALMLVQPHVTGAALTGVGVIQAIIPWLIIAIALIASRARPEMIRKALLVCGVLSSLVYVAANVVAGLSWDGYSFADQTISELSALGAPSRSIWMVFGVAYAILLVGFGVGVWRSARDKRNVRVAAAMLITIAVIGTVWPPMHLRGAVSTLTDTLHVVWAAVTSLLIMLAIAFGSGARGRSFRIFSLASIVLMLVFGGLSFAMGPDLGANRPTPWLGVLERINLGIYLAWVAVLGAVLMRRRDGREDSRLH